MTKFKTHLTAVITAIVFALLCFIPSVAGISYAYGMSYDNGGGGGADNVQYEKLYYFCDDADCTTRFNTYINQYLQMYDSSAESELIYYSDNISVEYTITQYFAVNHPGESLEDISYSFIIFEVNETPINTNASVTEFLNQYFPIWKGNGCKIMFICSTEEYYFEGYYNKDGETIKANRFLDEVDIHINTDLFRDFMFSVINQALNYGHQLYSCTFIFDQSLSFPIVSSLEKNDFIYYIYLNFIIKNFYDLYDNRYTNPVHSASDIFDRYDVNIFYYLGNGLYYDVVNYNNPDNTYNVYDLYDRLHNTEIHAVGTTWHGFNEVNDFFNDVDELVLSCGITAANYYLYNQNDYSLDVEIDFQIGNLQADPDNNYLKAIIYDFIMGNDLSGYDNFPECRCDVTYKPVPDDSGDGNGNGSGDGNGGGWLVHSRMGLSLEDFLATLDEAELEFFNYLMGLLR